MYKIHSEARQTVLKRFSKITLEAQKKRETKEDRKGEQKDSKRASESWMALLDTILFKFAR
jgi:hypothetical protein